MSNDETNSKEAKPAYPKRPKFFANKFVRLLTKAAVAQELGGPEACWLLAVIAHQEDSIHYSRPVTYYNEQLMPLCGFGGRSRLVAARDKAVKHGWLHYEAGGKGVPGTYWVKIPDQYRDVSDGPCDEGDDSISRPESEQQTDNAVPKQDGNRTVTGRQPDGKPAPSIPNPKPNPTKKAPADAGSPPAGLLELIDGWNALGSSIVAKGNGARRDPTSQAAIKGWAKAMKNPEQREALESIPAVLGAIRRAKFCHGQGWFTIPWLFGKNDKGEFNICRLLAGAHNEIGNHNGNGSHKSNGKRPGRVEASAESLAFYQSLD
ncbi:MAG: hypothetical protein RBS80_31800 [Thermoguttaceae bacterium]|jgi:hypothetical protein|nr:hypothetical protein [Thermoguttaceae bacterium]